MKIVFETIVPMRQEETPKKMNFLRCSDMWKKATQNYWKEKKMMASKSLSFIAGNDLK